MCWSGCFKRKILVAILLLLVVAAIVPIIVPFVLHSECFGGRSRGGGYGSVFLLLDAVELMMTVEISISSFDTDMSLGIPGTSAQSLNSLPASTISVQVSLVANCGMNRSTESSVSDHS